MAAHTTGQVSGCVHVANECERHSALDESYCQTQPDYVLVALRLTGLAGRMSPQLRPCCAETHGSRETRCDSRVYNNTAGNGGNPTCCVSCIDLTNFCHFLADPSVYGSHL